VRCLIVVVVAAGACDCCQEDTDVAEDSAVDADATPTTTQTHRDVITGRKDVERRRRSFDRVQEDGPPGYPAGGQDDKDNEGEENGS